MGLGKPTVNKWQPKVKKLDLWAVYMCLVKQDTIEPLFQKDTTENDILQLT